MVQVDFNQIWLVTKCVLLKNAKNHFVILIRI